ncbi:anti-sigma-F factor Fin [Virgibacillus halophilus]|uniref:Anti-sigma-F factor Fin family protein n=1 Tax=Tigheibacillus halophilus TaxID=361280 RepID=A0ABU5C6K0_9BACI|nr:anti-sigma-F factor Fin family protein [Virgibacillus halophilus]
MAIVYSCRHCKHVIGKIQNEEADISMLGWDRLSAADKESMIQYQDNGDIQIQTICENCQQSLIKNPHYHELDFFIQ